MKISFSIQMLVVLMLAGIMNTADGFSQNSAKVASGIEWAEKTFDFGKILQGNPVIAEFQFKNPSIVPLIINSVKTSCGCTIADYTKEPIQPQKTGTIKVTYDAQNIGYFQKSIAVSTNAGEGSENLIIKGEE